MDIMQAITFLPEEDRWIEKLAIGVGVILVSSVLSIVLVGILGFFILGGYAIRLLQNVRDGRHPILPEWNDWGGDLTRGFKYAVVVFVWGLVAVLLYIPVFLGAMMAGGDNGFVQFVGASIMAAGLCLALIYMIFFFLAQPGFTISFASDERIHSGLEFSKVWHWTRAHLGQVVIAAIAIVIGNFIISSLAGIVGLLLCGIGLVVTGPLGWLIVAIFQSHIMGQLAREFPMDGSQPATAVPPTPDEPGPEPAGLIETEQPSDAAEAQTAPEESAPAGGESSATTDESEPSAPSEAKAHDVWAEPEASATAGDDESSGSATESETPAPSEAKAHDVWAEPEASTSPEDETDKS